MHPAPIAETVARARSVERLVAGTPTSDGAGVKLTRLVGTPELPDLEMALLPASHRYVSKKWQDCNWVQSVEGALDTAHFSFLHAVLAKDEAKARAALAKAAIAAVHDEADSVETTDWAEVLALYQLLDKVSPGPMAGLGKAVAIAMVHGPAAGLDQQQERVVELCRKRRAREVVPAATPEERLLFAGDVACFHVTPMAFEGHIGNWIEVGLPPSVNGYHIVVTKPGYSTDQTYPITPQNPNPTKPDATIMSGQVTQVSIVTDRETGQSKGFGFVEMADDEAAKQAISQMNGKMVDNRQIQVAVQLDGRIGARLHSAERAKYRQGK